MITPIEIQSKTFKSGGLGYDKKDVDSFMRDVLKNYESLYRENMELNDKISVLTEGINYYKTIEKTLQKALVLAEKTAEETKQSALQVAKNIENEAITKSQLIVADAKNELEHIHNQTVQMIQQYEKYKAQFKNLAKVQMEMLESQAFEINVARLNTFVNPDVKAVSHINKAKANIEEASEKVEENLNQTALLQNAHNTSEEETMAHNPYRSEMEYVNHFVEELDKVTAATEESLIFSKAEKYSKQGEESHSEEEFDFINLDEEER
ncbi:MAG: DivIVA domain-containing protein [Lachnospiraceae bacterium]|nr:DivIVA domain-containing protein [Lachnospiraceae bacterium]